VSNKFLFPINSLTGKTINIPIEIKWDFGGRSDSIDVYQNEVRDEIIGKPTDYEISRYTHKPYSNGLTEINYRFFFFDSNSNTWSNSYLNAGFTSDDVYYFSRPFNNSFFKLDFYDTNNTQTQTILFTVIIPVQQGTTELSSISPLLPLVSIKKPDFKLDYIGDKEGFFLYWLRDPSYLNINTFYMSAKFFDARIGEFIRMITVQQNTLPNPNIFNTSTYFYRKVVLSYTDRNYEIFEIPNILIGNGTPINWYQYVNP
jgi:hypothetical protein